MHDPKGRPPRQDVADMLASVTAGLRAIAIRKPPAPEQKHPARTTRSPSPALPPDEEIVQERIRQVATVVAEHFGDAPAQLLCAGRQPPALAHARTSLISVLYTSLKTSVPAICRATGLATPSIYISCKRFDERRKADATFNQAYLALERRVRAALGIA